MDTKKGKKVTKIAKNAQLGRKKILSPQDCFIRRNTIVEIINTFLTEHQITQKILAEVNAKVVFIFKSQSLLIIFSIVSTSLNLFLNFLAKAKAHRRNQLQILVQKMRIRSSPTHKLNEQKNKGVQTICTKFGAPISPNWFISNTQMQFGDPS